MQVESVKDSAVAQAKIQAEAEKKEVWQGPRAQVLFVEIRLGFEGKLSVENAIRL